MLAKLPRPAIFLGLHAGSRSRPLQCRLFQGPWPPPHSFKKVGPCRWQCTGCLRRTSVWEGPLFKAPCGQVSAALQHVASAMHAHRLWVAVLGQGPRTIMFCSKCGAYFATEPKGLQRAVCAAPKEAGLRTLRRIQKGLHPDPASTQRVGKPWPLLEEQTADAP